MSSLWPAVRTPLCSPVGWDGCQTRTAARREPAEEDQGRPAATLRAVHPRGAEAHEGDSRGRDDDPERDFVFRSQAGGPIDPDNVNRAFERHLTAAGLPYVRFHDLRHTHASLLIVAGVHPKAMRARLGHSSITVTMDHGHLMPSAFEGVGDGWTPCLWQIQGKLARATKDAAPARRLKPAS
jgi:integrase